MSSLRAALRAVVSGAVVSVAVGCNGDGKDGTGPTGSDPTGDATVLDASCTVDPTNVLRGTCTLTASSAARLEVTLTDGSETAVFAADAAAESATIPVWGLLPASTWTFTARVQGGADGPTGSLATGELPEAIRFAPNRQEQGASQVVQVLVPLTCDRSAAYAVVFDGQGRVRWYQALPGREVDMLQFTEAGTLLGAVDRAELVEVDLAGAELVRWTSALPIHHEVFRRNDRIYALLADAYPAGDGNTYVEDVVVALDRDGAEVWRWEQHDWFDATLVGGAPDGFWQQEFPGAIDAWHSNGLFVATDGDLLLSMKKVSTLARISGSDGAIEWLFAGDGAGDPLPTDITFAPGGSGDPRFHDQHHPAMLDDGTVTVFDNGNGRGLALSVDEAAQTATLAGSWPVPFDCPIQSSVYPLDGGNHLVTCASAHVIAEFDAAGDQIGGFQPACDNGEDLPLTVRGQPIDLWGGWTAGGVVATRQ